MNVSANPLAAQQAAPKQTLSQTISVQTSNKLSAATGLIQPNPKLGEDVVQIRKGVLPTLKGAGAGLLAGGVLAGIGAYVPNAVIGHVTGNIDEYASLGLLMGGSLGAIAGAATGAVVANVTNDSKKAAIYGAAIGGGVGLVLGLAGKDIRSALTWSAMGAGAGLGGAWAGAQVAKVK